MMPFWLYTLGREFYRDYDVDIPYTDILFSLSVIFIPLSVGLFIQNKCPKLASFIEKIVTVLLTLLAITLIVTGIYSSLYIFSLFTSHVIIVGCALPYIGFILGWVVSLLLRQPMKNIITIAIEIGMQNTGIAVILLLNSFPPPFGDLSSVAPISAEVMSPIPPLLISIVYLIYKKCCRKYDRVRKDEIHEKADTELDVHVTEDLRELDVELYINVKNRENDG